MARQAIFERDLFSITSAAGNNGRTLTLPPPL